MRTIFAFILITILFALATGCADNPAYTITEQGAHMYGFWGGGCGTA